MVSTFKCHVFIHTNIYLADPLNATEIIKKVRFEWMSSKCVKLQVRDLVMSFNV